MQREFMNSFLNSYIIFIGDVEVHFSGGADVCRLLLLHKVPVQRIISNRHLDLSDLNFYLRRCCQSTQPPRGWREKLAYNRKGLIDYGEIENRAS